MHEGLSANLNILFLTEGGKKTGFGHITRCIALYQGFKNKNLVPLILVNADNSVRNLLRNVRYKKINWLRDKQRLNEYLKKADIAVIDSYLAGPVVVRSIAGKVKIPVYLDDNNRMDYPGGIVLNGSIYASRLGYDKRKDIIYLLGNKYIPLRKEFNTPEGRITAKGLKSILVTFGGMRGYKSIIIKTLKYLIKYYPQLLKRVIINDAYFYRKHDAIVDPSVEIINHPDSNRVRRLMIKSDLAISAGGQTLYELAKMGVPTIGICLAGNQRNNLRAWQKKGFLIFAGDCLEKGLLNKVGSSLDTMDYHRRIKMSAAGRKYVDGLGALRAVDKILKEYKKVPAQRP